MKVLIMTALTALLMFSTPRVLNAEIVGGYDTTTLPEYKGDLNNPECLIVYQNDKLIVVKVHGRYYFYLVK
ncbi:MAG: hypothetical protein PHE66_11375 [Syntrophaceticus schinkii]|jgi:hypothetical protein|nr:hypothetical protein [Syntrophaceticus schinkii]